MKSKSLILLILALAGALAVVSATQAWVIVELDATASVQHTLEATGQQLNASLSPVALAAIAAAAALAIAAPILRRVLAVLSVGLGVGIAAIGFGVMAAPLSAATGRIAELSGITGGQELNFVLSYSVSIWPWIAVVSGVVVALGGIATLVLGNRWKMVGRKYESSDSKTAKAAAAAAGDRIAEWDALSDGEDPSDSEDSTVGEDPSEDVNSGAGSSE